MNARGLQAAVVALGGALALLGSSSPAKVPRDWVDCEKELARFCPKAVSDDDIFQCLEKREDLGDRGRISDKCYAAYERYEVKKHGVNHRRGD